MDEATEAAVMKLIALAAAAALIAGAAHADPLRDAAFRPAGEAAAQAVIAAPPGAEPARPAGVAKTSLDHRFERDGLDGSLGFLCGLQPPAAAGGAMAARGVDPNGRFLGVKLHMSFR
jgi:hypothetical protein